MVNRREFSGSEDALNGERNLVHHMTNIDDSFPS